MKRCITSAYYLMRDTQNCMLKLFCYEITIGCLLAGLSESSLSFRGMNYWHDFRIFLMIIPAFLVQYRLVVSFFPGFLKGTYAVSDTCFMELEFPIQMAAGESGYRNTKKVIDRFYKGKELNPKLLSDRLSYIDFQLTRRSVFLQFTVCLVLVLISCISTTVIFSAHENFQIILLSSAMHAEYILYNHLMHLGGEVRVVKALYIYEAGKIRECMAGGE